MEQQPAGKVTGNSENFLAYMPKIEEFFTVLQNWMTWLKDTR